MAKTPEISVVVPVYGQFDLARTSLSIESILAQRGINYEVIVSEQGETNRFPATRGVKHVFKYHKPQHNLSDFDPGNVRNEAIANASGAFVYTNDADIVFLDQYYLADCIKAIRESPNKVFYRPFMRRLPLDEFSEFERIVRTRGIEKAIRSLDLSQEYIASINGKIRKIRAFEKNSIYRKIFTAFEKDFQTYMGNERNKGREPMFWNESRHCGGNLFRIEQFMNVGGYSEEFINWGCEDSDLQWKLSEMYDLEFFPDHFEVMHLDHFKGYFSPEMWKCNEETSKRRVKEGIIKAIEIDRRSRLWLNQ